MRVKPLPYFRILFRIKVDIMPLDPWHELRKYVSMGDYSAAKQLLAKQPSLISSTNSIGETVLHNLAVENFFDGVKWLHSMGSDINSRNRLGNSVLFDVALFEHKEMLAWLIENKVDITARNNDGDDIWTHLKESDSPEMMSYLKSLLSEKPRKIATK